MTMMPNQMGWTEHDLVARPKGHPGKVRLAADLRANTTMPLEWITKRLHIGSRGYLTWLLQHSPKDTESQQALLI